MMIVFWLVVGTALFVVGLLAAVVILAAAEWLTPKIRRLAGRDNAEES